MNDYTFSSQRDNLSIERQKLNVGRVFSGNIDVIEEKCGDNLYKTILFEKNFDEEELKHRLKSTLHTFFARHAIDKNSSIFIAGLGNDSYTADSVGPKTLKSLEVNAYLENLGLPINGPKVSALEPGVIGETGIKTGQILKSIIEKIEPDIVILVDSFIIKNIDYLNRCIELSDAGLPNDTGLKGFECNLDSEYLETSVISIGVPTAVEVYVKADEAQMPYILSSKDIDEYVKNISHIIGVSINEAISEL